MHIGASKFSLRQWTGPLCKFITIWGYGSYTDLICIRNDVQKSGFSWPRKSFSVHGMACKSCHSTVKLKQAKPSKCKCNLSGLGCQQKLPFENMDCTGASAWWNVAIEGWVTTDWNGWTETRFPQQRNTQIWMSELSLFPAYDPLWNSLLWGHRYNRA